MSGDVFEGLPEVDPESSPAVEAPAYPPRGGWQAAIREKGWERAAEVPGGAYYLDQRPRAVTVILHRPGYRPRQFAAATFYGPDMRDEAIDWARGKALKAAKAKVKKAPKKKRNNGPL